MTAERAVSLEVGDEEFGGWQPPRMRISWGLFDELIVQGVGEEEFDGGQVIISHE